MAMIKPIKPTPKRVGGTISSGKLPSNASGTSPGAGKKNPQTPVKISAPSLAQTARSQDNGYHVDDAVSPSGKPAKFARFAQTGGQVPLPPNAASNLPKPKKPPTPTG